MGCACNGRNQGEVYMKRSEAEPQGSQVMELDKEKKKEQTQSQTGITYEEPTLHPSTIEPEFQELCKQCQDPNLTKHFLDCSHGFCPSCAKQQLETQLKRKVGNIEYICRECRATKNLKLVLLECGCQEDVLQLDRTIRAVQAPDKILRYDLAKNQVIYPVCNARHPLTHIDLAILYGRKSFRLDLYRAKFRPESMILLAEELAKRKEITDLILDFCDFRKGFDDVFEGFIKKLSGIKYLSFRCAKFRNEVLIGIANGLKGNQHLTGLDLYSTGLNPVTLSHLATSLASSLTLQFLDLSYNKLDPVAMEVLGENLLKKTKSMLDINLENTGIAGEGMMHLVEGLKMNKTLKVLNLSDNLFKEEEAGYIKGYLASTKVLECLNLSQIFCSNESWKMIGEGIMENSGLVELNAESNKMENCDFKSLAPALIHHKTLRTLLIGDNGLDEDSRVELGSLISQSPSLDELSVRCNFLRTEGVAPIFNGLLKCFRFRSLNLRKNQVSNTGADVVASYLLSPSAFLVDLDISSNDISDEGGIRIINSLTPNKHLKKLNLSDNGLMDGFASALTNCLVENCCLEELALEDNFITNNGAKALADGVQATKSLRILNIENNSITQFGALTVLRARLHNLRVTIKSSEVKHFITSLG